MATARGRRGSGRTAAAKTHGRRTRRTWDRRANPARRATLLDGFLDYALEHGLSEVSIREAGRSLGTSGRMLIHYFGSREKLIVEALEALRHRTRERVFRSANRPFSSFDAVFWAQWRFLTSAETLRGFRLSYEALGLALRSPSAYRDFLDSLTIDWRGPFEAALAAGGFSRARSRAVSTAYLSALRGLVIELLVTGDRRRVRAAAALIAENLKRELDRPR